MTIKRLHKGFSTPELLMYSVGMVLVLGAIVYLLFQMYSLYKHLTIEPRVDRVGVAIVDRITKDIRSGDSINLAQSQFNTTTGTLTINTFETELSVIKKFAYDHGRVTYQENSGTIHFLTPDDMSVSRLYFSQANSPVSDAVRVELDITYEIDNESRTNTYTGFAILRHSYE